MNKIEQIRDPARLAALSIHDLEEQLLQIADQTKFAVKDNNLFELQTIRNMLAEASETACGSVLVMLEIAMAFIEASAGSDLTKGELLIREYCDKDPTGAEVIFGSLLLHKPISFHTVLLEHTYVKKLVAIGVLSVSKDYLYLRPAYQTIVRDAINPVSFRLWEYVNDARTNALYSSDGAAILESRLGVTLFQAQIHLNEFPLK